MLKTLSLIVVAAFACLMAGCDNSSEVSAPAADSKGNSLGIKADCYICIEHHLEPTDKTPHVEYKGKQYYFCSEDHLKQFDKDPEAAIKAYNAAKASTQEPTTAPK